MFKSLWKRFKENNFLAEGEEQIRSETPTQEDPSVTKQEETPVEATLAMNTFTKMGVDTFTVYVRFDRKWNVASTQLKAPTLSLLKLIKKRFDEGVVVEQDDILPHYSRIFLTDEHYVFFHTYKAIGAAEQVDVSVSLNFLDADEKYWIKAYTAYRLKERQEQENQKKRDALEQKLQSILNEGGKE